VVKEGRRGSQIIGNQVTGGTPLSVKCPENLILSLKKKVGTGGRVSNWEGLPSNYLLTSSDWKKSRALQGGGYPGKQAVAEGKTGRNFET